MKIQSTFRDMVTQSFLKWDEFWRYLPFSNTFQNIERDIAYVAHFLGLTKREVILIQCVI